MAKKDDQSVRSIPIDRIRVLNPRDRNQKKFREIVDSISLVGLKRPITVSRDLDDDGKERFNLVCGQGRLEAFQMLDQTEIPAIVIDANEEDCYLMSLVENLARRQHNSLELMRDIGTLSERGYSDDEIATKTGLTRQYVQNIIHLIKNGEERLVAAVERNQIPVTVAIDIANTDDKDIQRALTEAYERKELRGNRLLTARRIVQQRQRFGKGIRKSKGGPRERKLTAHAMVRAYKQETERQKAMILKADLTERRLLFLISSLKELFNDENFVTLLRAEGLETVPKQISDLLTQGSAAA